MIVHNILLATCSKLSSVFPSIEIEKKKGCNPDPDVTMMMLFCLLYKMQFCIIFPQSDFIWRFVLIFFLFPEKFPPLQAQLK